MLLEFLKDACFYPLLLIGSCGRFFIKIFPSEAAPDHTKYLTDQRQGLKVMAHFYASFRLHVARGRGAIGS
jgi:hypothetical protein